MMNLKSTSFASLLLMFLFWPSCQNVSGAIVIELEDTSSGLTMTMSGTLNTTGLTLDGPDVSVADENFIDNGTLAAFPLIQAGGSVTSYATFTTPRVSLLSLIISPTFSPSSFNSGDYFGYLDAGGLGIFGFETPSGFDPGDTISIRPNVTFGPGDTIASIFGANLSSTALVLSDFANGETLSIRTITTVPEPSSGFALATVVIAGLILRHRTCRSGRSVQDL